MLVLASCKLTRNQFSDILSVSVALCTLLVGVKLIGVSNSIVTLTGLGLRVSLRESWLVRGLQMPYVPGHLFWLLSITFPISLLALCI